MNKKYMFSTIFWYAATVFLIIGIIISIVSFSIASISMVIFCYLSSISISIYIEIYILGNRRSWWLEFIYIFFIRLPHFIELLKINIKNKKSIKTTVAMLQLINDEELPLFLYFSSFLKYYNKKSLKNPVIEVGIFDKDLNKGLLKRMSFLEFKFKNKYSYKNNITTYKMSWNNSTVIMYVINKKRNRFIRYSFNPDGINVYSTYALTLKEYSVKDVKFMGPSSALKYLKHYYGKDWRTTYPGVNIFYGPKLSMAEKSLQSNYVKKTSYL